MRPLNRKETEDLIVDLYYNQKKIYWEIQSIVRKSPRDIKVIVNKVEPEGSSLSIPAQAYRLFSEGKTPIEVAQRTYSIVCCLTFCLLYRFLMFCYCKPMRSFLNLLARNDN